MTRLFMPMKLDLTHFRGDLFGGLTTGVVALPLALAFGVASGLEGGASAGLYTSILLGFVAAVFGGTKPQVSGPTGPMTVVAAGFVATAGEPRTLFAAVFLGGVAQIAFGMLGLGHYIRYVPRPIVSGFMTGIGVILVVIQLQPLLGSPNAPGPLQALGGAVEAVSEANPHALLLGLGTVALIYALPRLSKKVPAALIALIVGTAVAEVLALEVPRIGALPTGLPRLQVWIPALTELPQVLLTALTLAILGSLDSLLGSVVVDQVTNTRHDSDKELVGQGMGNAVAGLFGGIPGAGATMRTLLNIRTGGATGLSGVIHSALLAACLLGLGRYASLIPLSVLAGILITVGFSIMDYDGLRKFPVAPRTDRLVLAVVLTLTVFVDLITAVQMGFLIAALLYFSDLSSRELTRSGSLRPMVEPEPPSAAELADRVQVIQAEGPIMFGTSEAFLEAADVGDGLRAIVLRMARVPLIDQTGAWAMSEFVRQMRVKEIEVVLSGLDPEPERVLRNLGVIPRFIPEDAVFPTLAEAVEGLNGRLGIPPEARLRPLPYLPKVGG